MRTGALVVLLGLLLQGDMVTPGMAEETAAVGVPEGNVGTVTIQGNQRYSEGFLRGAFKGLDPGQPLRMEALERALLLLNDYPGLHARAILRRGAAEGTTDIEIAVTEDEQRTRGALEFNTMGSRYASRERFVERVECNGLGHHGESLTLQAVHSPNIDDLLAGRLGVTLPMNARGTKLNLYGVVGDFEVGREFSILNMEGNGESYGLSLVQPLARTRTKTVLTEVGLDANNSELELLGTRASYDQTRSVRLGITVDQLVRPGGTRNLASLYVHQGLGDSLGGMADNDPMTSRAGADNRFTRVNLEAARLQRLGPRSSFVARMTGQYATRALVASEQMTLGGADSVRGYPQSELLGDHGFQATLEVRYSPWREGNLPSWMQGFQSVFFVDYGQAMLRDPLVGQRRAEALSGVGLGFRAELEQDFSLRADLGYALKDRDSVGGRFQPYFQAVRRF